MLRQAKEALRLVPNDPGWLATQEQAQSRLEKTKDKEQWLTEGNALNGLKRYDEALAAYEQAIRLDPNFAFAYQGKGNALNGLKRYEAALVAYEQALSLDPNYTDAYQGKGVALDNLGKSKEAQQAYNKARQLGYKG